MVDRQALFTERVYYWATQRATQGRMTVSWMLSLMDDFSSWRPIAVVNPLSAHNSSKKITLWFTQPVVPASNSWGISIECQRTSFWWLEARREVLIMVLWGFFFFVICCHCVAIPDVYLVIIFHLNRNHCAISSVIATCPRWSVSAQVSAFWD